MFNWYATNQDKGFPGMKANTTVDTVDSFASEGGINPGDPVIRGTDPEKQVKAASTAGDGAKVIGIAVHTHKDPNDGGAYYEDGYCLPVMTSGDIYVAAGSDSIVAGGQAFISISATTAVTSVSYVSGGDGAESIPGATFMENGSEGDIVRIRIRK